MLISVPVKQEKSWKIKKIPKRSMESQSETADLNKNRLLKWILAYVGLSDTWHLEDRIDPKLALAIAKLALALILNYPPAAH